MRKWSDLSGNEKIIVKRCIEALLRMNDCQIVFEKVDGEIRVANATLKERLISEKIGPDGYDKEMKPSKPRTESFESCRFFEIDKNQWRSFKLDSLISIAGNKIEDLIRI